MSSRVTGAVHRGLSRGLGIMLAVTAILFQRRELMTWREAVFLLACVVMQEAYLHLKPMARLRPLLIGVYFGLPTTLLIATLDLIEPYRGSPLELIQNTPVPVVLFSVQVMVLYGRESARLASIVLVLALFAVVIGLKRPLQDVTWVWLLPIGMMAAAYVALTFPSRVQHVLSGNRQRQHTPRMNSSPSATARPEYLTAMAGACVLVPVLAVLLFFFLPRIDIAPRPQAPTPEIADNSPAPKPRPRPPRKSDGGLPDPEPRNPSVTGLAESVQLGDFGPIKLDATKLGEVRPLGSPRTAPPEPLYLRTITFSRFDGQEWLPASTASGRITLPDTANLRLVGAPNLRPGDAQTRRYALDLKAGAFGVTGEVPLVPHTLSVRGLRGASAWNPATGMLTTNGAREGAEYTLEASVLTLRSEQLASRLRGVAPVKSTDSLLSDDYWALPLELARQLRENWREFPRLYDLAWSATQSGRPAHSAYAAARFVVSYFAEAKVRDSTTDRLAFEYSLTRRPEPGPDSVYRFLTSERYGHCEYFASAACAILRAAGIPCRLAAGFLALEFDAEKAAYSVSASDAHAWIEIYTEEFGWIALDPTPAQSLLNRESPKEPKTQPPEKTDPPKAEPPTPVDKPSVDNKPRDPFEAYSGESQAEFLRNSSESVRKAVADTDAALRPLTSWMPGFLPDSGIWRLVLLAIGPALVLLTWLWHGGRRRRQERRVLEEMGLPESEARKRGIYAQLLLLLAEHGHHKQASETPREFARRVVEKAGAGFEPLQPLTELFYRARFSLTKAAAEAEQEFKHGLSAFGSQLRRLAKGELQPPARDEGSAA